MNFVKALQCSVLIVFILSFNSLQAQKSTQKQLEEKKALLNKELKVINTLLFTNKQRKTAAFNDIENLNYKIERKQELIKLTNQQINLLNQEIVSNSESLEKLETDLFEVKEAYKEMILKSFKSKSGKISDKVDFSFIPLLSYSFISNGTEDKILVSEAKS